MQHPRGTDIPGQGGGVGITSYKIQTVCIIPVVLISPVRVVVLLSLLQDTDRMHNPRGSDIPVRVVVLCHCYQETARMHSPVVLISPVRVVVLESLLARYSPYA